jgi:hypothetical protein
MQAIALIQDKNGSFNIKYKEGLLVREESEVSFAQHNLLCFGRLDQNFTQNPLLRKGSALSVLEGRLIYSTSWLYYLEGDIDLESIKKLIADFNQACDRDYKEGLFEKRIVLKNIIKIGKNSLLIKIVIGTQDQEFIINI